MIEGPGTRATLLVEGEGDKAVLLRVLQRSGFDLGGERPQVPRGLIEAAEGIDGVLRQVFRAKNTRRLGIVVDADQPEDRRWEQLRDRLAEQGVALPASPEPYGTICPGFHPEWRVGVWMMPDNRRSGMLEDLLIEMVPAGQRALWSHAEQATLAARGVGASYGDRHRRKAEIHAWLAWQDPPGVGLGNAVRDRMFTVDCAEARAFVAWFSRLFELTGVPGA